MKSCTIDPRIKYCIVLLWEQGSKAIRAAVNPERGGEDTGLEVGLGSQGARNACVDHHARTIMRTP